MKIFLVVFFLISFFTIPAFGQEMEWYENSIYDFSFEIPTNWMYQEGLSGDKVTTYQVVMFPEEFSLENADESSPSLRDLLTIGLGVEFQIQSPLIGVNFENVLESEVPTLNESNLKEYALDISRKTFPYAKIIDSHSKTNSWGWEVTAVYSYDFNAGFGSQWPYIAHETTYFFKDRESYTVSYRAHENDYDAYKPAYDNVLDTMIIKSVAVPEFHEIAIMILGSGIIGIIAISKKMKILNS